MNEQIKHSIGKASALVKTAVHKFTKSFLGVTISRFGANDSPAYAASLAFYAFFSLFPLLLVLVSVGSIILEKYISQEEIYDFIFQSFPLYPDWIRNNLINIMRRRGTIGLVGLVTLTWSASGYFNTLVRALTRAWPGVKPRNIVKVRLVAIGMVVAIILLLILSFLFSAALKLLSHFQVPMGGAINLYDTFIWNFLSKYFPFIFSFIIFWFLYYMLPNIKVKKRIAIIGALPASLAWNFLNIGFTWFLSSGLVRYEIVYGSLSTIVSLLFWIYLSNMIILFGAYLSASAQYRFFPKSIPNHDTQKTD